jgi:hypothetical protein
VGETGAVERMSGGSGTEMIGINLKHHVPDQVETRPRGSARPSHTAALVVMLRHSIVKQMDPTHPERSNFWGRLVNLDLVLGLPAV